MKRLLSLLLTLCLLCSCAPAFGEDAAQLDSPAETVAETTQAPATEAPTAAPVSEPATEAPADAPTEAPAADVSEAPATDAPANEPSSAPLAPPTESDEPSGDLLDALQVDELSTIAGPSPVRNFIREVENLRDSYFTEADSKWTLNTGEAANVYQAYCASAIDTAVADSRALLEADTDANALLPTLEDMLTQVWNDTGKAELTSLNGCVMDTADGWNSAKGHLSTADEWLAKFNQYAYLATIVPADDKALLDGYHLAWETNAGAKFVPVTGDTVYFGKDVYLATEPNSILASEAVQGGGTLTLQANYTEKKDYLALTTITLADDLTVDLNGFSVNTAGLGSTKLTIKIPAGKTFAVKGTGSSNVWGIQTYPSPDGGSAAFTANKVSIGATVRLDNALNPLILTLTDCDLNGAGEVNVSNGSITLNGCTDSAACTVNDYNAASASASVSVNGGTLDASTVAANTVTLTDTTVKAVTAPALTATNSVIATVNAVADQTITLNGTTDASNFGTWDKYSTCRVGTLTFTGKLEANGAYIGEIGADSTGAATLNKASVVDVFMPDVMKDRGITLLSINGYSTVLEPHTTSQTFSCIQNESGALITRGTAYSAEALMVSCRHVFLVNIDGAEYRVSVDNHDIGAQELFDKAAAIRCALMPSAISMKLLDWNPELALTTQGFAVTDASGAVVNYVDVTLAKDENGYPCEFGGLTVTDGVALYTEEDMTLNVAGGVTVQKGGRLYVRGLGTTATLGDCTVEAGGYMQVTEGAAAALKSCTVADGGELDVFDATKPFTVTDGITLSKGASLRLKGQGVMAKYVTTYSGAIELTKGTLTVDDSFRYTLAAGSEATIVDGLKNTFTGSPESNAFYLLNGATFTLEKGATLTVAKGLQLMTNGDSIIDHGGKVVFEDTEDFFKLVNAMPEASKLTASNIAANWPKVVAAMDAYNDLTVTDEGFLLAQNCNLERDALYAAAQKLFKSVRAARKLAFAKGIIDYTVTAQSDNAVLKDTEPPIMPVESAEALDEQAAAQEGSELPANRMMPTDSQTATFELTYTGAIKNGADATTLWLDVTKCLPNDGSNNGYDLFEVLDLPNTDPDALPNLLPVDASLPYLNNEPHHEVSPAEGVEYKDYPSTYSEDMLTRFYSAKLIAEGGALTLTVSGKPCEVNSKQELDLTNGKTAQTVFYPNTYIPEGVDVKLVLGTYALTMDTTAVNGSATFEYRLMDDTGASYQPKDYDVTYSLVTKSGDPASLFDAGVTVSKSGSTLSIRYTGLSRRKGTYTVYVCRTQTPQVGEPTYLYSAAVTLKLVTSKAPALVADKVFVDSMFMSGHSDGSFRVWTADRQQVTNLTVEKNPNFEASGDGTTLHVQEGAAARKKTGTYPVYVGFTYNGKAFTHVKLKVYVVNCKIFENPKPITLLYVNGQSANIDIPLTSAAKAFKTDTIANLGSRMLYGRNQGPSETGIYKYGSIMSYPDGRSIFTLAYTTDPIPTESVTEDLDLLVTIKGQGDLQERPHAVVNLVNPTLTLTTDTATIDTQLAYYNPVLLPVKSCNLAGSYGEHSGLRFDELKALDEAGHTLYNVTTKEYLNASDYLLIGYHFTGDQPHALYLMWNQLDGRRLEAGTYEFTAQMQVLGVSRPVVELPIKLKVVDNGKPAISLSKSSVTLNTMVTNDTAVISVKRTTPIKSSGNLCKLTGTGASYFRVTPYDDGAQAWLEVSFADTQKTPAAGKYVLGVTVEDLIGAEKTFKLTVTVTKAIKFTVTSSTFKPLENVGSITVKPSGSYGAERLAVSDLSFSLTEAAKAKVAANWSKTGLPEADMTTYVEHRFQIENGMAQGKNTAFSLSFGSTAGGQHDTGTISLLYKLAAAYGSNSLPMDCTFYYGPRGDRFTSTFKLKLAETKLTITAADVYMPKGILGYGAQLTLTTKWSSKANDLDNTSHNYFWLNHVVSFTLDAKSAKKYQLSWDEANQRLYLTYTNTAAVPAKDTVTVTMVSRLLKKNVSFKVKVYNR